MKAKSVLNLYYVLGAIFVVDAMIALFFDKNIIKGVSWLILATAFFVMTKEGMDKISIRERIVIMLLMVGMFFAGYVFPRF